MPKLARCEDGGVDLEALKHSRNKYNWQTLERVLKGRGFESNGTTHYHHKKFHHPDFPEVYVEFQRYHKGSDAFSINQTVANACIDIDQRRAQRLEEEAALAEQFKRARTQEPEDKSLPLTADSVPEHIEVENIEIGGHACVVLRHKTYKCIGSIEAKRAHPSHIEQVVATMDDKLADFKAQLNKAKNEFELVVDFDQDGTLVAAQFDYLIGHLFKPFDPKRAIPPIESLMDFIASVELHDFNYRYDENAEPDDKSSNTVSLLIETTMTDNRAKKEVLPNGNIEWTVQRLHFLLDEHQEMKIKLSPQGRMAISDYYDMVDSCFDNDFGRRYDHKHLRDILAQHFGVITSRPDIDGDNDRLVLEHALYDLEFDDIPVASALPRGKPLWDTMRKTNDPKKKEELRRQLIEVEDQKDTLILTLQQVVRDVRTASKNEANKVHRLHEQIEQRGINLDRYINSTDKRPEGKPCVIAYTISLSDKQAHVPAFRLSGKGSALVREQDIRQALAETWPNLFSDLHPDTTPNSAAIKARAPAEESPAAQHFDMG